MKEKHLDYLEGKGRFKINLKRNLLTPEEERIVERWGHWFQALTNGTLQPYTEMQKNLVRVGKREALPVSVEECAWFKYNERKKIEEKYPDISDSKYTYQEEGCYTRKMARQMKNIMMSEMGKNHSAS